MIHTKNNNQILLFLFFTGLFLAIVFLAVPVKTFAADFNLKVGEKDVWASSSVVSLWSKPSKNSAYVPGKKQKERWENLNAWLTGKRPTEQSYSSLNYNLDAISDWVEKLKKETDSLPVEPVLKFEGERVTEFSPAKDGVNLDAAETIFKIFSALAENATGTEAVTVVTSPKMSLGETNSLGISELIGFGESKFNGSPSNRRVNIAVGVKKMKGVVVAPGEVFSFNHFLGPVEASEGFLPELVIKRTGTVPELGGGLCQVSSTVFRAAMNTGLPIVERRNHAYAVQYYAPQGTDATIYPGIVDFRFRNNTRGSIMIWPVTKDRDSLRFEFYGTKDDRVVELEKPVSYDKQKNGAMKATWTRHITMNGTTTTDTFKSNYVSPDLYHKKEEYPKPATPVDGTNNPAAPSTGAVSPSGNGLLQMPAQTEAPKSTSTTR